MDGTIGERAVWRDEARWQARWRITERLRQGQFCTGYVVQRSDGSDPTSRFLKVLERGVNAQQAARLHNEATALAAFEHPRILRLIEANTQHPRTAPGFNFYLVAEYVAGPTLADFGAEKLPLPLGIALDLSRQLLDVVSHVHERGYLHGDINLENVILRDADLVDPVLVDFNLSAAAETVTGTVADRLQLDWRNDLRQVARILFWELTGKFHVPLRDWHNRAPHRRTQEMRAIHALGAPSGLLNELFDRAFALELHDRFQSVDELRTAMDRVHQITQ